MAHTFLSYVRDDSDKVQYVASVLRANGIEYWLDVNDLTPGTPWRDQLRLAIQQGSFFLPFFSPAWTARESTVANEELLWAIEELRRRPTNRAWFIPFLLEGGSVPDRDIGGGMRLADIQYLSVDANGWQQALSRLLKTLGVENPILDGGEPLGTGLPSIVKIADGWFAFDTVKPPVPQVKDLEFQIVGGTLSRSSDGVLIAEIRSRAPNTQLQRINELLGLDYLYCVCPDENISVSADNPSCFSSKRTFVMERGTPIPPMFGTPALSLPFDLTITVDWTALGSVVQDQFEGTFQGLMTYMPVNLTVEVEGRFVLNFQQQFGLR